MKKIFIGAVVLCMMLMVSCSGNNAVEKGRDDSARIADSITQLEAAKAAAEQARQDSIHQDSIRQDSIRQDSIRQDSIVQEEKMRIDPKIFSRDGYEKKLLNQYGFKVVYDRKFINYDIDEGFEDYEIRYTRTFNGRKIVYDAWGTTCMGATLTFYNPLDKKHFIEDINKAGYKKENPNFYVHENPWHVITFEGNKAHVIHCD